MLWGFSWLVAIAWGKIKFMDSTVDVIRAPIDRCFHPSGVCTTQMCHPEGTWDTFEVFFTNFLVFQSIYWLRPMSERTVMEIVRRQEQGHLTPRSLFFSHTRTSIQKNRVCIFPGEWAQLTQMESRCRRSFTTRTEEPCEEASGLSVLRTWGHAGLVKLFALGTIHLA